MQKFLGILVFTAIYCATIGSVELTSLQKELLDAAKKNNISNADLRFIDIDTGNTLLHLASMGNYTVLVSALITKMGEFNKNFIGQYVNKQNNHGDTALHLAAQNGHDAVVARLLLTSLNNKYLIEATKLNNSGNSPLGVAILNNRPRVVIILLEFLRKSLSKGDFTNFVSDHIEVAQNSGFNNLVPIIVKYLVESREYTINDLKNLHATLIGLRRSSQ